MPPHSTWSAVVDEKDAIAVMGALVGHKSEVWRIHTGDEGGRESVEGMLRHSPIEQTLLHPISPAFACLKFRSEMDIERVDDKGSLECMSCGLTLRNHCVCGRGFGICTARVEHSVAFACSSKDACCNTSRFVCFLFSCEDIGTRIDHFLACQVPVHRT